MQETGGPTGVDQHQNESRVSAWLVSRWCAQAHGFARGFPLPCCSFLRVQSVTARLNGFGGVCGAGVCAHPAGRTAGFSIRVCWVRVGRTVPAHRCAHWGRTAGRTRACHVKSPLPGSGGGVFLGAAEAWGPPRKQGGGRQVRGAWCAQRWRGCVGWRHGWSARRGSPIADCRAPVAAGIVADPAGAAQALSWSFAGPPPRPGPRPVLPATGAGNRQRPIGTPTCECQRGSA